jgi:hypothetical protein
MWWNSEERVVKRRSQHLMDVLTISPDTRGMFRRVKAFSMNGILTSQFEIQSSTIAEANGFFDRAEMESAYAWICGNAKESKFKIIEFSEVKIEGDRADVVAKVEGFIEINGKRPTDGVSEVTLFWEKSDEDWLLRKVIWN